MRVRERRATARRGFNSQSVFPVSIRTSWSFTADAAEATEIRKLLLVSKSN